MILQISLNNFKHWKIFPTIDHEQMKEEENCAYAPRFQIQKLTIWSLYFSALRYSKNLETKTKETENVGQFQFVKEVEGTYVAIM